MICPNCKKEIKNGIKFCNFCGEKITKEKTLDENNPSYKKIKNAGSTAEALGWFNLFFSTLYVVFSGTEEGNSIGFMAIDCIYLITISLILIKFGKKAKKVTGLKMKDLNILLTTIIFIIFINLINMIYSEGDVKIIGLLFILELIYLIRAKSALKQIYQLI